jgi:hypothetical protein
MNAVLQEIKNDISKLSIGRKATACFLLFCQLISFLVFVISFNWYSYVAVLTFLIFEFIYCVVIQAERKSLVFEIITKIKSKIG